MPEFVAIGKSVTVAAIRDYLFAKKIDKGDSLMLSAADYEHIIEEIKNSDEPVDIPVNVLGVLLIKDNTGNIPVGKVQIIEDDKM